MDLLSAYLVPYIVLFLNLSVPCSISSRYIVITLKSTEFIYKYGTKSCKYGTFYSMSSGSGLDNKGTMKPALRGHSRDIQSVVFRGRWSLNISNYKLRL